MLNRASRSHRGGRGGSYCIHIQPSTLRPKPRSLRAARRGGGWRPSWVAPAISRLPWSQPFGGASASQWRQVPQWQDRTPPRRRPSSTGAGQRRSGYPRDFEMQLARTGTVTLKGPLPALCPRPFQNNKIPCPPPTHRPTMPHPALPHPSPPCPPAPLSLTHNHPITPLEYR